MGLTQALIGGIQCVRSKFFVVFVGDECYTVTIRSALTFSRVIIRLFQMDVMEGGSVCYCGCRWNAADCFLPD